MQAITIVPGYNVLGENGRIVWETLDVFEAFRIARRRNGCVERIDVHGGSTFYYAENGNRIMSSVFTVWE